MPDTLEYGLAPPGYRLPSNTRIGLVRLQVSDLARSLAWYRRVLGVEVLRQGDRFASLAAPGSAEALVELHELPGATPVPRRGRLGLYHFAILLPDRPALGAFVRHLSEIGERAGMSDHLVSEAVYLSDPDGLGIEVYADRPRTSWSAENGQLVMRDGSAQRRRAAGPGRSSRLARPARRHDDRPCASVRRRPRRGRRLLSCGPRLRQDGVELPGSAVPLRRGLSPPPRHQHLGGRCTARRAGGRSASGLGAGAAGHRGHRGGAGQPGAERGSGAARGRRRLVSDPWGTTVRLRPAGEG